MNVEAIIQDYDLIPYGKVDIDRYVVRVIKALNKYAPDGESPLAEDLEDFDSNDPACRDTLKEAIEWLRRHGKEE